DYSGCRTEDFATLMKCREEAAAAIGCGVDTLELSMGMSADYENAILEGSTSVRVGSSIFGARQYPPK
ncbi:PLPBP, partial [Symbiodinium necroappetens]